MKKSYLSMAVAILLSFSMLGTSCVGSFALTNKLLSWNRHVGNKFVNEFVFFAFWVLPVYEVSALADVLVLNSIEFWSGENPVADAGTKSVHGSDGKEYLVEYSPKGYVITDSATGAVTRLDFDATSNSWSIEAGGERQELMTFVDATHVSLPSPDGKRTVVELSDDGLMAYRNLAEGVLMARR